VLQIAHLSLFLSLFYLQLPVMAWSWVTNTRKYYAHDYLSAATVTLGCMLFVVTGDISAPEFAVRSGAAAAASFTAMGLGLLAVFMVFDGLTCTSQDKLFSSFNMHSCNQLLYTAAWSALLSAGFLAGSGQAGAALGFVRRHPGCLWLMVLQSAVSTAVQLFIVFTIKQYGALNFALMMTLRQFLSIVLSCMVFAHSLAAMQWLGTLLVISGLLARSLEKAAGRMDRKVSGAGGLIEVGDAAEAVLKNKGSPPRGIAGKAAAGGEQQPLLSKEDLVALGDRITSPGGGKAIAASRPFIPVIAGSAPMVSVLQPFGNVLSSLPSGDLKEKPG
jgi:drug/metabolite transporter (DMT)-like permease